MINVAIPDDFADDVTRLKLLDSLRMMNAEVRSFGNRIQCGDVLSPAHATDFSEAKKMRKSLRRVLRYYSTSEQWVSYELD